MNHISKFLLTLAIATTLNATNVVRAEIHEIDNSREDCKVLENIAIRIGDRITGMKTADHQKVIGIKALVKLIGPTSNKRQFLAKTQSQGAVTFWIFEDEKDIDDLVYAVSNIYTSYVEFFHFDSAQLSHRGIMLEYKNIFKDAYFQLQITGYPLK